MQFRKKLVFSMVYAICKFGITYILPNNSWIMWRFRSVKLVVYAVHAQCMQCCSAVAIRCLASRAIIHGARWCVGAVLLSVSGCAPSPPSPPRGAGKAGRLSGDSPCVTTHSLLRLPAKHCPIQHSTRYVSRVFTIVRANRRRTPSRYFIHYLVDVHLVFSTFDAIL